MYSIDGLTVHDGGQHSSSGISTIVAENDSAIDARSIPARPAGSNNTSIYLRKESRKRLATNTPPLTMKSKKKMITTGVEPVTLAFHPSILAPRSNQLS